MHAEDVHAFPGYDQDQFQAAEFIVPVKVHFERIAMRPLRSGGFASVEESVAVAVGTSECIVGLIKIVIRVAVFDFRQTEFRNDRGFIVEPDGSLRRDGRELDGVDHRQRGRHHNRRGPHGSRPVWLNDIALRHSWAR